jgi:hypothetical protein
MNDDPLYLISNLKGMFPGLDDEILLSALLQNNGNIEKTIDCLLILQAESGSNINKPKEISLFNNIEGIPNKFKKEQKKEEKKEERIEKPKAHSFRETRKENTKKPVFDNQLFIDDTSPVVNKVEIKDTKPKKTLTQKIGGRYRF